MAGISSDGDSRLLRSMKINTRLGRLRPIEMPSFFNSMITETAYVQDPTHIGTKLRNKILQPSILLPMGNKQVSIAHLKILIEKFPKSYHGLSYNDICPEDRQNFGSLQKVMSRETIKHLENIPESEGTIMYLKLCQNVTSAFMDQQLSPLERVYRMWYSIFFLRIWRKWVLKMEKDTKIYTLTNNFITSNAYDCIELNGHALIQLIIKFRDENKAEYFIPSLFSSQPCESTFRQFRSMTSIFWTKINSSLREMFHIVGRIELQNNITHYKLPNVIFPRIQRKTQKIERLELPANEEMFEHMILARCSANDDAKTFGMYVHDDEDVTRQIPVCQRKEVPEKEISTEANPSMKFI